VINVPREDRYVPEEEPSLEVPEEYLKWRSEPDAKKRGFKEITKDTVLANLSEDDLEKIRVYEDNIQQNLSLVREGLAKIKDIKSWIKFLESQIFFICNSSVGFKGFGRSLDTTIIQLKHVKTEDETRKGKFSSIFRRRR